MGLSNDERGWVMTSLSGIACIVGASIICVDVLIRLIPGKADFRIQDSDTFLSLSLSLSFGVMLYSALNNMLPSAKAALITGGFTAKEASWILIVCFLGGVVGIQIISRIMHSFMPTHAVDCDHTHEDESKEHGHAQGHDHPTSHARSAPPTPQNRRRTSSLSGHIFQDTPGRKHQTRQTSYFTSSTREEIYAPTAETEAMHNPDGQRRPALHERVTNTLSVITSGKPECDTTGHCYGLSDPCGNECFKNVHARGGFRAPKRSSMSLIKRPSNLRISSVHDESTPLLEGISENQTSTHDHHTAATHHHRSKTCSDFTKQPSDVESSDTLEGTSTPRPKSSSSSTSSPPPEVHHHHHVPSNAFLSIGLQTSIAIALHKLPEGFITYATNHANPRLGVSVFLALFIHNITEGFAMALPLYLAINSRVKAMGISFVLGGLSQPLGAAVAAIWFKIAGQGDWAPSEGVYGAMFAVTAGIMASVALQLFSESLDLTHSRSFCMLGAFTGMGILGVSGALTARD